MGREVYIEVTDSTGWAVDTMLMDTDVTDSGTNWSLREGSNTPWALIALAGQLLLQMLLIAGRHVLHCCHQ